METIENPVIGDKVTFIKTARQTNGEKSLLEIYLAPKGGNPLHYHKFFSETFTVKEGELKVQLGSEIRTLYEGESVTIPMRTNHRFFSTSDKPAVFTVELQPASEGFENGIKIAYGLARDGKCNAKSLPKNIAHLALLFDMSDGNIPGLTSMLEPVFKWIARRARAKGIEKELLAKYCLNSN